MKKNTKKSLLFSVLALILCTAMLLGTTFAWFTDSASTKVNTIQAGTLNISATYQDVDSSGTESYTMPATFIRAPGGQVVFGSEQQFEGAQIINEQLWEPGKVGVKLIKVKNDGNLAAKVKLQFNVQDDGLMGALWFDLMQVENGAVTGSFTERPMSILATFGEHVELPVLPQGELAFILAYGMNEEAGNEYQNKSFSASVTVLATQYTHEEDSFGNTYDENATYPEARAASTAASFAEALSGLDTTGNKNVVINVVEDINNITGIKTANGNDLAVDFGSNTVTVDHPVGSSGSETNGMQLLQGSDVTLRNGTYKPSSNSVQILVQNYSDLTLENVTLDATNNSACQYVLSTNCGNVVIKGATNIIANSDKVALDVMHWENTAYKEEGTSVVFDQTMTGTVDGKIDVYCYRDSSVVKPVDDGGATLTIMGGTFKNTGLTFEQFKAYVPSGYKVVVNSSDESWTVQAA